MADSKPVAPVAPAAPVVTPAKPAAAAEDADPGINAAVVDIPREVEPGHGEGDGVNANIVS